MVNRLELWSDVEKAFEEVVYPNDDALVFDQSGRHLECNSVAETFRGLSWKTVATSTLQREASALFFLSRSAYVYFLPAYLKVAILEPVEADIIPGVIIDSLIPSADSSAKKLNRNRLEWLTLDQRCVTEKVLLFFKEAYSEENILGDIDRVLNAIHLMNATGTPMRSKVKTDSSQPAKRPKIVLALQDSPGCRGRR